MNSVLMYNINDTLLIVELEAIDVRHIVVFLYECTEKVHGDFRKTVM